MKTIELNASNFNTTIASEITLVDFWAPWCGPCKMQLPILEQVAEDLAGRATLAKVNIDDTPELAARYGVRSIPTLLLFKEGEIVQQFIGVQQKNILRQAIESAMEK